MILHAIYAKDETYSIFSKLKIENQISSNKKNLLNMTNIDYKLNPNLNNVFSFMEKEVFFIINHGGGAPTVFIKTKPIIQNSFSERRIILETYIKLIRSSFSLNIYESKKIFLMAVCFAAKKPTFGSDILAVELAKKLRIHVLAADSIVNLTSVSTSQYVRSRNGGFIKENKAYIQDISTHGNWYLIDPHGKMQKIEIFPRSNSLTQNSNPYRTL